MLPTRSGQSAALSARSTLAFLVLALTLALTGAGAAHAGTYRVWSCTTPSGTPTSTEGWVANTSLYNNAPTNSCGQQGGHLGVGYWGPTGHKHQGFAVSRWEFVAPPNTTIGPVALTRLTGVTPGDDFRAGGAYSVFRGAFAFDDAHLVDRCLSSYGCSGGAPTVVFDGGGAPSFGFEAGCYGPPPPDPAYCVGNAERARAIQLVMTAEVNLIDSISPTATSPGGTVLDAGARSGSESLTFVASDAGGGVWQAEVKLGDTVVTPRTVVDRNGGRCDQVAVAGGTGEFGYPVPCKTTPVTANLPVDTTKVTNGEHILTATVYDAAGNATTAISKRITVANAGAAGPGGGGPNGSGGDRATGKIALTGLKKPRITTHYGAKVAVTGRLADAAGNAITGATIDVYETVDLAGAAAVIAGTTTTGPDGAFTYRPRTRGSRTLEFAYAERVGYADYRDRVPVELRVRAAVSLKVSSRRPSIGKRVRFTGKVRVDPFPKRGVTVAIQVRRAGRWQPVENVRARVGGTFTWSHRFATRGHYQFRARVLGSGDLPARPGTSRISKFRVR